MTTSVVTAAADAEDVIVVVVVVVDDDDDDEDDNDAILDGSPLVTSGHVLSVTVTCTIIACCQRLYIQ